ncbi:MAG: type IV conjugative transfer system protein TraE [Candidatus Omnitrophica bacterium]|nr:type IV conjugative transfer system protein TraE [Candidatus Omnitrophota bacterium]
MEKRRKLWEIWAESEIRAKSLQSLVIFLGTLLAVETFSFTFYLVKPKPIYYINGAKGFAFPVKTNDEMVKAFAEGFIANLANYTPSTIAQTYTEISDMVSPGCLALMQASLSKEQETIKNNSVSSLFALESIQIKKNNNRWKVKIRGQHSLYMEGQELKNGLYQYTLKIIKTTPTEGNPFGLMIDNISGGFITETGSTNP